MSAPAHSKKRVCYYYDSKLESISFYFRSIRFNQSVLSSIFVNMNTLNRFSANRLARNVQQILLFRLIRRQILRGVYSTDAFLNFTSTKCRLTRHRATVARYGLTYAWLVIAGAINVTLPHTHARGIECGFRATAHRVRSCECSEKFPA